MTFSIVARCPRSGQFGVAAAFEMLANASYFIQANGAQELWCTQHGRPNWSGQREQCEHSHGRELHTKCLVKPWPFRSVALI